MRQPEQRTMQLEMRDRLRKGLALAGMFCLLGASLAACNTQPAIVVATPQPPDANFRRYEHPSGVFSLRLPADWSVRDVSRDAALRVEFSPPNNTGLPLTVYAFNTGAVLGTAELLNAVDNYQKTVNRDLTQYQEVSRTAQGDGSWRVIGVRQTPIGQRAINTFIQGDGAYFSAIEADVTGLTAAQLETLRAVINTYRVNTKAAITASTLVAPAEANAAATGVITFGNLYTWSNPQGAFIINGMITNTATTALEAIVLTAQIFDAAGTVVAEQQEVLTSDVLSPGGNAAFSIRFRSGKPSQTQRYEIRANARYAEFAVRGFLGDESFLRGNDIATYNADGFLTVTGDVVNKTQGLARFIKAVVTVFDEQGNVVATETTFLTKADLLPGESSRFQVVFFELGGNAARYEVHIEGKQG